MQNKFTTFTKSSIWTTAVAITTNWESATKVYIKAYPTNTANIYIGGSTVTTGTDATDWIILTPNDWIYLDIWDPSRLYAISTASSQKISVLIQY